MNHLLLVALLASVGLSACSKKEEAAVVATPAAMSAAPAAMPAAPAASAAPMAPHGSMASHGSMAPVAAVGQNSGKVVQTVQGGGYTYAEVETGGRKVWIAGAPIQVKAGDSVQWGDYSIMQNFTSKTLNRTFDEILFVNAWGPAGSAPTPVAPHGKMPGN